jgi:hypothetical protein
MRRSKSNAVVIELIGPVVICFAAILLARMRIASHDRRVTLLSAIGCGQ